VSGAAGEEARALLARLEALAAGAGAGAGAGEAGARLTGAEGARLLAAAARLYEGPPRLLWGDKALPPPPPPLTLSLEAWGEEEAGAGGAGGAGGAAWRDLLVEADNLAALAALAAPPWRARLAAAGGVRLLYLDPPFNVGADFEGRVAVGGREVHTLAYRDAWGEGAASLAQALYARLAAALPLLAPDASVYVHVDDRMSATARLILDELLGVRCFRNEVIWWYKDPSGRVSDRFKRKHDTLLFYALSPDAFFDVDAVRLPYAAGTLAQARRGTRSFGRPVQVHPLGKLREDVWEVPILNSQARERVGYPTQKPEALLELVLRASSRPGDVVLDPFCGSGTTLAVAARLGRRWVGVDAAPLAVETARRRLCAQGAPAFALARGGAAERLWALGGGAGAEGRYAAVARAAWGALPGELRGAQRLYVVPAGEALSPAHAAGPLRAALAEALRAGASGVDVLAAELAGWAWGPAPWAPLRAAEEAARAAAGVSAAPLVRVWLTPRDALDPRATPARLDLLEPLLPRATALPEAGGAVRLDALEPPADPRRALPAGLRAADEGARPLRLLRVGGALLGLTRGGALRRLTDPAQEADLAALWLEGWAASWGGSWAPRSSAERVARPPGGGGALPRLRLSCHLGAPLTADAPDSRALESHA